jgi:hypothetical protein
MITVITGAPCSGKTTYIKQHAKPGDITVDFDEMAKVLGNPPGQELELVLAEAARAAWHAVVDVILQHPSRQAWIIHSRPSEHSMLKYRIVGARVVKLTVSRAELHARAIMDGRPEETHRLIDLFLDGAPAPWEQNRE